MTIPVEQLTEAVLTLPAEARAQLADRILESLQRESRTGSRFAETCGCISPEDAAAMKLAVLDCERVDPRGW